MTNNIGSFNDLDNTAWNPSWGYETPIQWCECLNALTPRQKICDECAEDEQVFAQS